MALVLLVEDNPTNRKLMRDVLEIRFEVVDAPNAEEALDRLRESTPQLILMDLQLPGMDGLTLVRRLKQDPRTQPIPIVAISAHAMKQNIDEAMAAGCAEYVTKPLVEDPFAFVERLEKMIAPTEP